MLNITPTTNIIDGMRQQGLPWHIILGEFIDNSFDAGATRIQIEFDKNELEITDDGVGCKNLGLMLRPGARESKASTQLGRYGIGAKDAAISAADAMSIVSVCEGVKRMIRCDWRLLQRSGNWEIDDPQESKTDQPSGTKIILNPLRSDRLKSPASLIERLSLHYTPAIRQGKQIVIRTKRKSELVPVPEFKFPPLEHQMTADVDADGKLARVTMGLVPEGGNFRERGLVVSYGYRVIKIGDTIGLGCEPTPGLFGWVELGSGWELTKNKENISSNTDELADVIYRTFREVIDRAAKRSQSVHFGRVRLTTCFNGSPKSYRQREAQTARRSGLQAERSTE